MISIIICSKIGDISYELRKNIANTIGVSYEIIVIDNSNAQYSICQAYNIGINKSKGEYVCFIHEDVIFKTNQWGNNLISHLNIRNVGFVGVAGSSVITRIPAPWSSYKEGKYINIIQKSKKSKKYTHMISPKNMGSDFIYSKLLDGVFLAIKKSNLQNIKFDENLKGFHGYDFDISLQGLSVGLQNIVVYDILLLHDSYGKRNYEYYKNLIYVFKKHESLISLNFNKELELKQLRKFCRRLINNGYPFNIVMSNLSYYAKITSNNNILFILKFYVCILCFFRSVCVLKKNI